MLQNLYLMQTPSRRTFIFLSPRYIPTNKDSKIYDFLLFYNTEPFRAIITNSHESFSRKRSGMGTCEKNVVKQELQILSY